jgi:hypothetical protein
MKSTASSHEGSSALMCRRNSRKHRLPTALLVCHRSRAASVGCVCATPKKQRQNGATCCAAVDRYISTLHCGRAQLLPITLCNDPLLHAAAYTHGSRLRIYDETSSLWIRIKGGREMARLTLTRAVDTGCWPEFHTQKAEQFCATHRADGRRFVQRWPPQSS